MIFSGKKGSEPNSDSVKVAIFPERRKRRRALSRGDAFKWYRNHSTHCEEWGTKHPDRGARFLARVSRHEVPKTAGKRTPVKIYDPARVSH